MPHSAPPSNSPLAPSSQFDFHQHLPDMTGTTLVAFTSPDCGSCRHLRNVLLAVHELQPAWHLLEIDAQRESGLVSEFEVFHLPTIFLFSDGQFHCELQAEARPPAIIEAVRAALQQPPAAAQ